MFLTVLLLSFPAYSASRVPQELKGVDVEQHLGKNIDLSLTFTDFNGKKKKLGDYFDGKKPVLLTLNYYSCPMLCTLQLNGLIKGLASLKKGVENQFRIVTVSIDPKEKPHLAAAKRETYLKELKGRKFDWQFLVGEEKNIKTLAKSLGFGYRYNAEQKQYAHPAVIFFLTPKGKISQYLKGVQYPGRDLNFSLITASQGKIGSVIEKIFMSCFIYNSKEGKYTQFAFGVVRLGGLLTVIVLALFLATMWLREREPQPQQEEN